MRFKNYLCNEEKYKFLPNFAYKNWLVYTYFDLQSKFSITLCWKWTAFIIQYTILIENTLNELSFQGNEWSIVGSNRHSLHCGITAAFARIEIICELLKHDYLSRNSISAIFGLGKKKKEKKKMCRPCDKKSMGPRLRAEWMFGFEWWNFESRYFLAKECAKVRWKKSIVSTEIVEGVAREP